MERAEAKLHEVRSSLDKIREQEQRALGVRESFNQYLSALLSAGMSVRDTFHVRQDRKRNEAVKKWRETWEARLTPEQMSVYEFMRLDRNAEVHADEVRRVVKMKEIKVGVGDSHRDKSGILSAMGSPGCLIGADTSATIRVPQYFFDIDGIERPVTEVCAEYLALLEQMVADYKTDPSR